MSMDASVEGSLTPCGNFFRDSLSAQKCQTLTALYLKTSWSQIKTEGFVRVEKAKLLILALHIVRRGKSEKSLNREWPALK